MEKTSTTQPVIKGNPSLPPEPIRVNYNLDVRSMQFALPNSSVNEAHPIEVVADYWGRNPRLQILCYEAGDPEGAPKVCIRYGPTGKIEEVVVGLEAVMVMGNFDRSKIRDPEDTSDTPWEIARDENPPCAEGDYLRMPSGLLALVMRLRDRYDGDIEAFREYDSTYAVLSRLNASLPEGKTFDSLEQAWEVNPLTAGTTDPGDFSFVPELKQPAAAEEAGITTLAALETEATFSGTSPDGVITHYFDKDMVEIGYSVCPHKLPVIATRLRGRAWSRAALERLNIVRLIKGSGP